MSELVRQSGQDLAFLTDEQRETLEALKNTHSKTNAAKALGIARSTLYERLKDPDLRRAYDEYRADVIQDTFDTATDATVKALTTLFDLSQDTSAPPSVRVSAASKLCDIGIRTIETEVLKKDVEELKRVVGL
jgi:hypothetical protein